MSDINPAADLPTAQPGVELACALAHFDLRNPLPHRAYQIVVEKVLRNEPIDDYLGWQQKLQSLDPKWLDTDPAVSFELATTLLDFARAREQIAATALVELDAINFAITTRELDRLSEMVTRTQNVRKQILKFWHYLQRQVPAQPSPIEHAA